jgi:translation initiation factor 2 subunit 2
MPDDNYMELLKKAKIGIPMHTSERFEVPRATVVPGRQTAVKNFSDIAKTLRRDGKHIAKFLFKELAVPGSIRGNELYLQGRIGQSLIDQRISEYVKEFVMCNECGKPDTNLQRVDKVDVMKCEACGARRSVRTL